MRLGCERRHAQKRGAGIFGDFLKKQLVEIWLWARWVEIWLWAGQPAGGWLKDDVGTVIMVKIMPLSPRVEKPKLEKLINVSYLNYRESSVFQYSAERDFYAYEHFTYSYFDRMLQIPPTGLTKMVWFLCLMAYQLFLGYLMPKLFS